MIISNDYTIVIPHEWSGEEALIVVGFLEQIAESIWNLHHNNMMAAMRRRNATSGPANYQAPSLGDDHLEWTPPATADEE